MCGKMELSFFRPLQIAIVILVLTSTVLCKPNKPEPTPEPTTVANDKLCKLDQVDVERACNVILDGKGANFNFSACRKNLRTSELDRYYQDCVKDLCRCESEDDRGCICKPFETFAAECARLGACVDWRSTYCPMTCPDTQVYKACSSSCKDTCEAKGKEINDKCDKQIGEGCFCQDGFVEDVDGKCVQRKDCSCKDKNKVYPANTTIEINHQSCVCEGGSFKCPVECKTNEFQCKDKSQCISKKSVCDKKADCRDQSDETNCQTSPTTTGTVQTTRTEDTTASETTPTTVTTPITSSSPDFCIMKTDVPDGQPLWIEKDNIPGPTNGDKRVRPGDKLEPDDRVHVGYCEECVCRPEAKLQCYEVPNPLTDPENACLEYSCASETPVNKSASCPCSEMETLVSRPSPQCCQCVTDITTKTPSPSITAETGPTTTGTVATTRTEDTTAPGTGLTTITTSITSSTPVPIADACHPNPCQNGGTCLKGEAEGSFKCVCPSWFVDKTCSED